jgi:di/tricarboxylate transporter
VQRSGEERPGKTTLAAGDTLLLHGAWEALEERDRDPNLRVVDAPNLLRRELAPLSTPAWIALAIVAGMVVLLVTGVVPPAISGALAAVAIVLFRVLTIQEAYRGISWSIVVLIAGMIPLSTAMTQTGAAADIADGLVSAIGKDASPYILIIALFVLVAAIGQVLSNTATALIVFPVAVAAAAELDISVQPVLMSVTIAAHASFLTPIATTPNLMVLEPGGYQFADFWKFGLPLMALYFIVAIAIVPLVWRF